jgi:hypothetical protein
MLFSRERPARALHFLGGPRLAPPGRLQFVGRAIGGAAAGASRDGRG